MNDPRPVALDVSQSQFPRCRALTIKYVIIIIICNSSKSICEIYSKRVSKNDCTNYSEYSLTLICGFKCFSCRIYRPTLYVVDKMAKLLVLSVNKNSHAVS